MIHDRSALPDLLDAPEIQRRAVQEGNTRDNGKCPSSSKAERVAKVEQRGSDTADKDRELEPGEEGAFGGELDFGLDADRDVDSWNGC